MRVAMDFDVFERLPRHPDWRYEYWDGALHLSHRPRSLSLRRPTEAPPRPARAGGTSAADVVPLSDVGRQPTRSFLTAVWEDEDPYRSYDDHRRSEILIAQVTRTLDGEVQDASVGAVRGGVVVGAALVVRETWPERERRSPVLTWLSVDRKVRSRGVATVMLAAVCERLMAAAEPVLFSACSVANVPSLRWHLTNGFTVLPDPLRELQRRDRS